MGNSFNTFFYDKSPSLAAAAAVAGLLKLNGLPSFQRSGDETTLKNYHDDDDDDW